jgi:hypothetical protein
MELIEIIHRILQMGELSPQLERQLYCLLDRRDFNAAEIEAIDLLIEALCRGTIQSVPNRVNPALQATDDLANVDRLCNE